MIRDGNFRWLKKPLMVDWCWQQIETEIDANTRLKRDGNWLMTIPEFTKNSKK